MLENGVSQQAQQPALLQHGSSDGAEAGAGASAAPRSAAAVAVCCRAAAPAAFVFTQAQGAEDGSHVGKHVRVAWVRSDQLEEELGNWQACPAGQHQLRAILQVLCARATIPAAQRASDFPLQTQIRLCCASVLRCVEAQRARRAAALSTNRGSSPCELWHDSTESRITCPRLRAPTWRMPGLKRVSPVIRAPLGASASVVSSP